MKELTIEELKQMPGQPVWCPEAYMRALNKTHNADLAVQVAMGVTFAVTNTLEAQKPKTEAQPQAQGINPAALLAAMFANAANQQPRDDTGNESDDDE